MKYQIGVIGSGVDIGEEIKNKARRIGREIAKYDAILLTGGCWGIPYAAVLGAKEVGGYTIAISPASNKEEHEKFYKFPTENFDTFIFTGFGKKGRNVVMIRSCDAVIGISGRIGTTNELTIAYDEGKIIGLLLGTGGITDEFDILIKKLGKEGGIIIKNKDPEKLVENVIKKLNKIYQNF